LKTSSGDRESSIARILPLIELSLSPELVHLPLQQALRDIPVTLLQKIASPGRLSEEHLLYLE
jgi:hypothetical protein